MCTCLKSMSIALRLASHQISLYRGAHTRQCCAVAASRHVTHLGTARSHHRIQPSPPASPRPPAAPPAPPTGLSLSSSFLCTRGRLSPALARHARDTARARLATGRRVRPSRTRKRVHTHNTHVGHAACQHSTGDASHRTHPPPPCAGAAPLGGSCGLSRALQCGARITCTFACAGRTWHGHAMCGWVVHAVWGSRRAQAALALSR